MNKDLPKIYAVKIDKDINNDMQTYYGSLKNDIKGNVNIDNKINKIFASKDFVYKKDVVIITKNSKLKKTIVGKNDKQLLTLDNTTININDIVDIEI